jgi:low temperature requirement protein LtrA
MLHYPIIVGIVFFAVSAEDIVAHPEAPLSTTVAVAMALGIAMVLVSIVASVYRTIPRVLLLRVATGAVLMVLVWLTDGIDAVGTAAIVAGVMIAELIWEHTHHWHSATAEIVESPDK